MTLEDEINLNFTENPDLYNRTLKEIARFFMIQGQIRYSLLEATVNKKADYFAMRLKDASPEAYEKAYKEWNKAASITDKLQSF